jgi:hypothetical protein
MHTLIHSCTHLYSEYAGVQKENSWHGVESFDSYLNFHDCFKLAQMVQGNGKALKKKGFVDYVELMTHLYDDVGSRRYFAL